MYIQDVTANAGRNVLVGKHLPIFFLGVEVYQFSMGILIAARFPLKLPVHQVHHTKAHGGKNHGH
jgi:hypothetical protein